MHIMLDIKTYSQRPDAAICQIGAAAFTLSKKSEVFYNCGFHRNIVMEGNTGYVDTGMAVSLTKYTPKQVKEDRLANQVSIAKALQDLYTFPEIATGQGWDKVEGVWALDSSFDIPALELAYYKTKHTPPWKRRAVHGLRTLFLIYGGFPQMPADNSIDLSNALHVCFLQAEMAIVAHKKITQAKSK